MPNNRTRLPLPEPARVAPVLGVIRNLYTADQMHAYSDAENAGLRERLLKMSDTMKGMDAHEAGLAEAQAYLMARVKVLEDALGEYIAAADNTITCNDKDMTTAMLRFGDADKAARDALEAK